MAVYQAPGVYVEEVPSSNRPIAGVGTSIAGFVGVSAAEWQKMPLKPEFVGQDFSVTSDVEGNHEVLIAVNTPIRITNWEEFKKSFGDFDDSNEDLAHGVYGFFNNGGTACWVIRSTSVSDTDIGTALNELKGIDEVAIVAAPGVTEAAAQKKVVEHCEAMEDRFAIIDGSSADTTDADTICAPIVKSQNGYCAVYFPWIQVSDPLNAGETIAVAPSGHMAGIYARSDNTRGVHKAPANEMIRGALGVAKRLNRADHGPLNDVGINVIRDLNGSITVMGGRTFTPDVNSSPFKYVNIRRLMNAVRESIDEGTRWTVFEPNDQALWKKIRRNITAYLTNVWRDGALFGETPSQAFYVKCDEETNPAAVRDLGIVVTEIGIATVKPAEFVVFRISHS